MTVGRRRTLRLVAGTVAGLLLAIACWAWLHHDTPNDWTEASRHPGMRPDYRATVIPPNIAPLNFVVDEPGTAYYVRVEGAAGRAIAVHSSDGGIRFPPKSWKSLLAQNRGSRLSVEVFVRDQDRRWQRFEPIQWTVAEEEIDSHLVYRVLDAVFEVIKYLGIYQRDLETSRESPLVFNSKFDRGCVNCHTFLNNRPDQFLFHTRPSGAPISAGPVLVRDGKAARIDTRTPSLARPANISTWHPSGNLVAFSVNWVGQFIRGTGTEPREVFDLESDLAVVDLRTGDVSTNPGIADPDRLEAFPSWSADGKHLFFSSAPRLWPKTKFSPLADYKQVKYDLMRISYDAVANRWGKPERLLAAAATGKSILEPRPSPDGRYLLFCMCDHGAFPVFEEDSDLYLMDLANRSYRLLDQANSSRADSWHSWSSNSRWIVFSSKRDNGLVARPYLCYVDSAGQDHKPFVLPQSDPRFYDTCLKTYNVPELVTGPVTVPEKELLQAVEAKLSGSDAQSSGDNHHQYSP